MIAVRMDCGISVFAIELLAVDRIINAAIIAGELFGFGHQHSRVAGMDVDVHVFVILFEQILFGTSRTLHGDKTERN